MAIKHSPERLSDAGRLRHRQDRRFQASQIQHDGGIPRVR